ncbi:MAG: hypothetical protein ACREBR_04850 [bacterium]
MPNIEIVDGPYQGFWVKVDGKVYSWSHNRELAENNVKELQK